MHSFGRASQFAKRTWATPSIRSLAALAAAIALTTAFAHAEDAADSDAGEPETILPEPSAHVVAAVAPVRLPPVESRNIERVTYSIEGEEGEHAEVSVSHDGAVRIGRSRRGTGGGLPVLRTRVRRVRNPRAFFDGIARLCAESSFADAPESRGEMFGMWQTLTIQWAGHSRTIVIGRPGLTRELVMHVVRATGVSSDGFLP